MNRDPYLLPNGRVLRYSFHERLIHWMAGISYVYLLLTGLAFWTPWLFWIAVVLGGGTAARGLDHIDVVIAGDVEARAVALEGHVIPARVTADALSTLNRGKRPRHCARYALGEQAK